MQELKQIYKELRENNIYITGSPVEDVFDNADKNGIIYMLVQTISQLYKEQQELKSDLRKAKYKLHIL